MVDSEDHGAVVLGENGRYYLDEDRLEGKDPLSEFGPNVITHLKRTNSFPDAPDILVNSLYDPAKNEGAAFEELIGFHGGLGGYQTRPFLLIPSDWNIDDGKIIGAEQVYSLLKSKLNELQII
jgi:putative membrane protein